MAIIAGVFEQDEVADRAIRELQNAGFDLGAITKFFVNPPGQHGTFPIGGDEDESPGTESAPTGSIAGAAAGSAVGLAAGLAALPMVGPAAPIAGAGVGAYAGSLLGALEQSHAPEGETREPRKSGMLVAVAASTVALERKASDVLRSLGAQHLERAQGTVAESEWIDFDPLAPPVPVE